MVLTFWGIPSLGINVVFVVISPVDCMLGGSWVNRYGSIQGIMVADLYDVGFAMKAYVIWPDKYAPFTIKRPVQQEQQTVLPCFRAQDYCRASVSRMELIAADFHIPK